MKKAVFRKRVKEVLAVEFQEPMRWMYLSFADEKFLGVVIIKAHGTAHACQQCCQLRINPGGQMMAVDLPEDLLPAEKYRNRLLTREEVKKIWPDAKSIREFEAENA